ncbi:fimbria/pilus periplasmic chaperone [Pantoea sp. BAV 3049]|uniref:fimbria/pilus periplasmic chaperone n=1 Tax=Pantoea sp. BAV 3049 TaxID=2654188 RepID=UPI00131B6425|nr:fimbria/pilus periplasmic chaperone [Pantoea sp. BAV 3049]
MFSLHFRPLIYARLILLVSGLFIPAVNASVTLTGSRIIYPGSASSVDVQLKNNDNFPYVIQTWFDNGDINTKPDAVSNVPFIAAPPVFRVQPQNGQIIRVAQNKNKILPQDRESVFWFNVLQIPPANIDAGRKNNKILITLRTRIKLFYRPASLGAPDNLSHELKVRVVRTANSLMAVEIINPRPWHASLSTLQVTAGGVTQMLDAEMIAPFSSKSFALPAGKTFRGKSQVVVTLVNDQGARISERYDVTFP